jgi:hypothetical protein
MTLKEFSKRAEYFIELVGLAIDSIGQVIIDNKYALIQLHAEDSAAIVPPVGMDPPSFDEVLFYTNFLAYAHDIPAFIWPDKGRALIKPIERGRASYINQSYYISLRSAYEAVNSFRFGPLTYVYFRWPGFNETTHLPLTVKYSLVSKEVGLYSTAIRQLDPLSEFLCYYRIIESISGDNGKDWISINLSRLGNYNFGFLEIEVVGEELIRKNQRRENLFSYYRRRALSRLGTLTTRLPKKSIAEYFYNENRCGIAHGRTDVKTYDFGFNIREISQDIYILKLLARMAIEDECK